MGILYGFVIFFHILVCLILIAVILLQAGRGGGLSETFGGESAQTIFGTKTSVFLTRATVVAASLFLVTCLLLGIMTARRGRSLIRMDKAGASPRTAPVPLPERLKERAEESVKESAAEILDKENMPPVEPEQPSGAR